MRAGMGGMALAGCDDAAEVEPTPEVGAEVVTTNDVVVGPPLSAHGHWSPQNAALALSRSAARAAEASLVVVAADWREA